MPDETAEDITDEDEEGSDDWGAKRGGRIGTGALWLRDDDDKEDSRKSRDDWEEAALVESVLGVW